MPVSQSHLDVSGFYHTALDSLMDNLFISSTPNVESQCSSSRIIKTKSGLTSEEDKFFSICSTSEQSSKTVHKAEQSDSAVKPDAFTPKRIIPGARKQKLFDASENEEFQLRTRSCNTAQLSPQTQLLKKAIIRMEHLQRRQDRIARERKPVRTSLRV